MKTIVSSALALALLLPLAACSQSEQSQSPPAASSDATAAIKEANQKTSPSWISGEIRKGMQEAREELAHENIDVNNIHVGDDHDRDDDARPKAEITPRGELLIAGKKVAATPAQQTLLLAYRRQIVGIAEAGMDIGAQGADIGLSASRQALWGAFTGKSDKDIEAAIKPQTDKIKAAAFTLCRRLPGMLTAQQQLAAAMPAFRPYATMEQKDVDDCGEDIEGKDGKDGVAVFSD